MTQPGGFNPLSGDRCPANQEHQGHCWHDAGLVGPRRCCWCGAVGGHGPYHPLRSPLGLGRLGGQYPPDAAQWVPK